MTLREAVGAGLRAARVNLLPGLFLQALMACFIAAYLLHDGTAAFLARVGEVKQEIGYAFAFVTYMISGALLPELLKIVFFQRGRPSFANLQSFATTGPFLGFMGMTVDFFYRCQNAWFGAGNDWQTLVIKVLVDQILYSPFIANLWCTAFFTMQAGRFSRSTAASLFTLDFITEKVLPVQIAGWGFWFPAVTCIYFMPPQLQIPVAVLVQTFWVLMLTTITARQDNGHQAVAA
jgi:hypothetical protein